MTALPQAPMTRIQSQGVQQGAVATPVASQVAEPDEHDCDPRCPCPVGRSGRDGPKRSGGQMTPEEPPRQDDDPREELRRMLRAAIVLTLLGLAATVGLFFLLLGM